VVNQLKAQDVSPIKVDSSIIDSDVVSLSSDDESHFFDCFENINAYQDFILSSVDLIEKSIN
jgi:hypothetical protein